VEFLRFGASSLDFEMRFYLADLSDGMDIRNKLRIEILERFKKEGIEIPYPTQDVHIRREPAQPRFVEMPAEIAGPAIGENAEEPEPLADDASVPDFRDAKVEVKATTRRR
jgi:small-conductance mechanosensitive channel